MKGMDIILVAGILIAFLLFFVSFKDLAKDKKESRLSVNEKARAITMRNMGYIHFIVYSSILIFRILQR